MSGPVDVLAVMTVSERLLANSDFHGAVAYVNRVTEARAAVAELIRASKAASARLWASDNVDDGAAGDALDAALARCGGAK